MGKLAFDLGHVVQILEPLGRQICHRRRQGLKAEYVPVTCCPEDFPEASQFFVEPSRSSGVEVPLEQL